MKDVMYRVSTQLRRPDQFSIRCNNEYEQCGSLYYFLELKNACKAAIEFNTGVVTVVYNYDTRKSDHWYEE